MAQLSVILPYVAAATTIATTISQGRAQQKLANIEADQLDSQAIADQAEAVQGAKQERRRADFLESRVTALAAASGTALSSPGIQRNLSDIDEQGEYNALAALHTGMSSAASKRFAARTTRFSGEQGKKQSELAAAGTLFNFVQGRYG